ncbi:hypothetical protein MRX96_059431 [Rhipicephalus microplus]
MPGPGTDPGTSGFITQDVTAKRKHLQSLDSSFVETPGTAKSLPGAATFTVKLRRRRKILSLASPRLLTTPRQRQQELAYPLQSWANSPENWTVDDVAEYVSGIPGCGRIAEKFRHHDIDGGVLFLIKEHHLIRTMDMKVGPALKMCATTSTLREVLS